MSKSNLVQVNIPANIGNYTKGRSGKKIEAITIHHMAGVLSAEQCGSLWQNPKRKTSSHYGIGNDGKIGQYVDEADISWCNSNWDSNCKSVTIEVSNCSTGGEWKVGDKALNSLIKLVADIAKRNNLGTLVKGKNVTWHSMFTATACPGNYLMSKMDYIIEEANKINEKNEETTPSTKFKVGDKVVISGNLYVSSNAEKPSGSIKNKTTKITRVVAGAKHPYNTTGDLGWMNEKDIRLVTTLSQSKEDLLTIVKRTIRGDFGNQPERQKKIEALGYDYKQVREQVNKNYANGTTGWNNIKLY